MPPPDQSLGEAGPGMFQVISLGDGSSSAQQVREYKKRKPHKKSKGGCQACKLRRVRCDQDAPVCQRCKRNDRPCVYPTAKDDKDKPSQARAEDADDDFYIKQEELDSPESMVGVSTAASSSPDTRSHTTAGTPEAELPMRLKEPYYVSKPEGRRPRHARDAGDDDCGTNSPDAQLVARLLRPQPIYIAHPENGTPTIQLIHHFHEAGTGIYEMPNFIGPLIPLALEFPHLRGTILAAAANHLDHKAPGCKDYYLAKHYQKSIALREYQKALNTPFAQMGQNGVDALLITAMLINMLAFAMPLEDSRNYYTWGGTSQPCVDPDPDPKQSWLFSADDDRLGFLAIMTGATPLVNATADWREHSRLRLLYANSDDERRILSGNWQSLNRVPTMWLRLFGIDPKTKGPMAATYSASAAESPSSAGSPDSTTTTDMMSEFDCVYRGLLRVIAELQHIEPTWRTLLQYFQVPGKMPPAFRRKLFERDEKALWLYGMWMGQLCRFPNVWWTRRRTRCDFRAIRLWLHVVGVHTRPGDEGAMWRALLADLDATWGYDFATDPLVQQYLQPAHSTQDA